MLAIDLVTKHALYKSDNGIICEAVLSSLNNSVTFTSGTNVIAEIEKEIEVRPAVFGKIKKYNIGGVYFTPLDLIHKTAPAPYHHDLVYRKLLNDVLTKGYQKDDRTDTGTISLFGTRMEFDLTHGIPLLTTKHVSMKNIISELVWFMRGDTNISFLLEHNNHIWTDWVYEKYLKNGQIPRNVKHTKEEFENAILNNKDFADKHGSIGSGYGKQWRNFNGTNIDQLANVIHSLKENPDSRRHIVSAWNPIEIEDAVLPPCHTLFQFDITNNALNCQLYQRSADVFLGVPYNIASYSLLTIFIAQLLDLELGKFVWTGGDTHIYKNHIDQVREQLKRDPKWNSYVGLRYSRSGSIDTKDQIATLLDTFEPSNFVLEDRYDSHPAIKAPVAV